MISIEEARQKILSYVGVLEPEEKPIMDSIGQVLAQDVYSDINVPPLDNSAMDGYAIQSASTKGTLKSNPIILKVIGEVAAGSISDKVVRLGTAIRIMTGAPIPAGADTVVQFEKTDEQERSSSGKTLDEIGIFEEAPADNNIRRAGEDIKKGDLVLKAGVVIRPQEVGLLASLGYARVAVIRRPVVAVLATGDELVNVGEPLPLGRIYNSNTYSIASQVVKYGGVPKILGIARDTIDALWGKISDGLDADMLITSAGVSMGDYDVVKDVLAQHGQIAFWTVSMKPGKPLAFGTLNSEDGRKVPHLGLPGNPVSSMVSFEQFASSAIFKMLGKKDIVKSTISAISESNVKNKDGRRVFTRVFVRKDGDQYYANSVGPQGSGILTSMGQANGLMITPEDVALTNIGDSVEVQMLDWTQEQS
ncbi:MAG: molybdopterin molybdotransferase MoeA [Chloroflexi bacterium]|jgi:molybdopterin molybdotransferase|nr:molybdopterin molybdotransferase MoeA [Chloroflexota bacterium]MBT7081519.1 molybdopterin molybdotransferase MoeA [Chloroflexota bacterium]